MNQGKINPTDIIKGFITSFATSPTPVPRPKDYFKVTITDFNDEIII